MKIISDYNLQRRRASVDGITQRARPVLVPAEFYPELVELIKLADRIMDPHMHGTFCVCNLCVSVEQV